MEEVENAQNVSNEPASGLREVNICPQHNYSSSNHKQTFFLHLKITDPGSRG